AGHKMSNGDLDDAKYVEQEILDVLPMQNEMQEVKGQLQILEKHKAEVNTLLNQEAYKKQTLARAKEMTLKQFAANSTKWKESLAQVAQYQRRGEGIYTKVKGLPTRPKKEKKPPLIARFVPGLTLQLQKPHLWWVDLNPSLRFRVR